MWGVSCPRHRKGCARPGRRSPLKPRTPGVTLPSMPSVSSPSGRLENFVAGEWVTGSGKAVDLFHAVTGEKIAEASTAGIDFAAMVHHARTVGGPALRKMTFHERARMLKALAKYLMERKDDVLRGVGDDRRDEDRFLDRHRRRHRDAVRVREPRTPRVSRRDVLRRRRAPKRCRRAARSSVGTSACRSKASPCTSTRSTSPCGGCSRSSPPTLLAGVPAIVKPATLTSYLTEAVFRGDDRVEASCPRDRSS